MRDGYRAMKKLLAVKPARRCGLRRERSLRHRRDEGDLGSGPPRAGRHRRRRRGPHRARRPAPRAADDGELVARRSREARSGADPRADRSRASGRIQARRHPAAAGGAHVPAEGRRSPGNDDRRRPAGGSGAECFAGTADRSRRRAGARPCRRQAVPAGGTRHGHRLPFAAERGRTARFLLRRRLLVAGPRAPRTVRTSSATG